MFYWVKTNRLIKWLFPDYVWDLPNQNNSVYLTFDDGPNPEITPWILDLLKRNNVKATFFCVGENIKKQPELARQIVNEGHAIANHTYNHLNGWKTQTDQYLQNIKLCEETIEEIVRNITSQSKLFRPPYGKITKEQSRSLRKTGYQIIMWDVLTADFDIKISREKCLENATKHTVSGSIIVFHDNPKAFENLQYTLPKTIDFLKEKGFRMESL